LRDLRALRQANAVSDNNNVAPLIRYIVNTLFKFAADEKDEERVGSSRGSSRAFEK